jgi:hypothetical protein
VKQEVEVELGCMAFLAIYGGLLILSIYISLGCGKIADAIKATAPVAVEAKQ